MRFQSLICLAWAVITLAHAAPGQESLTAADLLEFIPDVVADYGNGEQLRGAEVKLLIAPQVQAMLASGQKPLPDQVRAWTAALVDGMVNQRLVLREALRCGGVVDLDAGRRLVADQQERLGRQAFERALRLQGVSADELAQRLAENAAADRWLATIVPAEGSSTEPAAQAYYDQHPDEFRQPVRYHVAHVLIAVAEEASEAQVKEARDKAAGRRAEIARGESFAAVAARSSDCPSKADGGDLGFLDAGRLPPPFEQAALSLEPGQISEPVRSPFGWHIIRGGDVLPGGMVPFAAVCAEIQAKLRNDNLESARRDVIRRLREKAAVTTYVIAPVNPEPATK